MTKQITETEMVVEVLTPPSRWEREGAARRVGYSLPGRVSFLLTTRDEGGATLWAVRDAGAPASRWRCRLYSLDYGVVALEPAGDEEPATGLLLMPDEEIVESYGVQCAALGSGGGQLLTLESSMSNGWAVVRVPASHGDRDYPLTLYRWRHDEEAGRSICQAVARLAEEALPPYDEEWRGRRWWAAIIAEVERHTSDEPSENEVLVAPLGARTKIERAMELLQKTLGSGTPVPLQRLLKMAHDRGLSTASVYKARNRLGNIVSLPSPEDPNRRIWQMVQREQKMASQ